MASDIGKCKQLRWIVPTPPNALRSIGIDFEQLTNREDIIKLRDDQNSGLFLKLYRLSMRPFHFPDAAILLTNIFQWRTKPRIRFETIPTKIQRLQNRAIRSLTNVWQNP